MAKIMSRFLLEDVMKRQPSVGLVSLFSLWEKKRG
jgi:hypothetical protein